MPDVPEYPGGSLTEVEREVSSAVCFNRPTYAPVSMSKYTGALGGPFRAQALLVRSHFARKSTVYASA